MVYHRFRDYYKKIIFGHKVSISGTRPPSETDYNEAYLLLQIRRKFYLLMLLSKMYIPLRIYHYVKYENKETSHLNLMYKETHKEAIIIQRKKIQLKETN